MTLTNPQRMALIDILTTYLRLPGAPQQFIDCSTDTTTTTEGLLRALLAPAAEVIYESCEAAIEALGPCPRALAQSDGGHWWYIDHEAEAAKKDDEGIDYLECVCKSCPQKMRLSADAEEFPT